MKKVKLREQDFATSLNKKKDKQTGQVYANYFDDINKDKDKPRTKTKFGFGYKY